MTLPSTRSPRRWGRRSLVGIPSGEADVPVVTERVADRAFSGTFEVSARGFWQVHPGAAATFVDTVMGMLAPREGEIALDLYAGVGLFAAALAQRVGESGKVVAVESDSGADRVRGRQPRGIPVGRRGPGARRRRVRGARGPAGRVPPATARSDSASCAGTRSSRCGPTSWCSTRRGPEPAVT